VNDRPIITANKKGMATVWYRASCLKHADGVYGSYGVKAME
jgi:hypothetical protein